jgi:hypothetical protein
MLAKKDIKKPVIYTGFIKNSNATRLLFSLAIAGGNQ